MEGKWFEVGIIAFGAGILLDSFFPISFGIATFAFFLAATSALAAPFVSTQAKQKFALAAFIIMFACAGVARYELGESRDTALDSFKEKRVVVEGIIDAEPDVRETLTFLTVSLDTIDTQDTKSKLKARVRIGADRYPESSYGDRVRITGVLSEPKDFETKNGTVFDYRSYLAKDGIYYEMFRPKIEFVESGQGNPILAVLLEFKATFLRSTAKSISEPENGLLAGIMLGVKHGIPEELGEAFRKSGLVHIIVLSGYNLTIVAYAITGFLKYFSRFLPRFVPPLSGALGIIAFMLMAGASATAVRAAIMALLVILAGVLGRKYDIMRALALAAFCMMLQNPKVLAFDPSFQLSFLATLGLVFLSPFFKRRLSWVPERFGLREIISATFATQAFVLPRLVGISGSISLLGVFANIIVLPFVPLAMFSGALTGFLGFLHTYLAVPFAFIAYILLHAFILVARLFATLPFAAIPLPYASSGFYLLLFIPLFIFLIREHRQV